MLLDHANTFGNSIPSNAFYCLGAKIPIVLLVLVIIGVIFIICGNYLPKSRQNQTMGIKLPLTLRDVDIWNKTNRMAGVLWIAIGFGTDYGYDRVDYTFNLRVPIA